MRRRFHNHNLQFSNRNKSFSLKWSIIWIAIHFASLLFLTWGIAKLGLDSNLIILLLTGFGVTIISRIVRVFTLKKRFIVDKWFFFWSLINTFTIWVILLLGGLLQITNNWISLLITALGLVIVAYFVKKIRITRTVMIITSIILILVLLFFNWNTGNLGDKNVQNTETKESAVQSTGILSTIKSSLNKIFSSVSIDNNCPQINVPMTRREGLLPFLNIKEYDGWTVASYDSNSQIFGFNFGMIFCHIGNRQGQNPKYWYCGDQSSQTTRGYIQKTLVNEDGTLGKTIKRSFYNIYDENENFIKTTCGENPDKIAEQEWEDFKRQAEDFWS